LSQQINLYDSGVARKPRGASSLLLYAISAAVLVAALTAIYEQYQLRRVEADLRVIDAKLKEAQTRHETLAPAVGARKPDASREAEMLELLAQVKRRQEVINALKSGAVGTTAGFSEFMLAFSRQSLAGVWLTGFDIDAGGKELTLSGRALAADLVPRYLERLNREPLMHGRQFSSLKIDRVAGPQNGAKTPAQPSAPAAPPPAEGQADSKRPAEPQMDTPKPPEAQASAPRPTLRYVEFSMSSAGRDQGAQPNRVSTLPVLPQIPTSRLIEPARSRGAAAVAAPAPAPEESK
jgi:hypothetical protein